MDENIHLFFVRELHEDIEDIDLAELNGQDVL